MQKFVLAFTLSVGLLAMLNGCGSDAPISGSQTDNSDSSLTESSAAVLEEIDHSVTDTLVECGYTIEHASAMQEILNTVGVHYIEIQTMTGEPESGLNAVICFPNGKTEKEDRFHFTTEDGILFYAGFSGDDLYDSENGGFLKSYQDVVTPERTISMEVYEELRTLAETGVKRNLNYPDTADFGMLDWGIGRSDDQYQVVGSVTAKTGTGVKETISFSVWFEHDEDGFHTKGVSIDGIMVQ